MKIEKCTYCSSIILLAASEDVSAKNTHKKKYIQHMFMALPAQICVLMTPHRHLDAI